MEATELRIGNIVDLVDRCGKVHLPIGAEFTVVGISLFKVELVPVGVNPAQVEHYTRVDLADLAPKPLTEDWLKRFGFTVTDYLIAKNGIALSDINGVYSVPMHDSAGREVWRVTIEHVHQLQNFYEALRGERLYLNSNAADNG